MVSSHRESVGGPSAGSELRSTVRQIQSKSTEFVCLSSTRPLSTWLGTALDGQTDCVKTNRIRLSVVNPSSAVRWLGTALDGQTDSVKKNRIRLSVTVDLNKVELDAICCSDGDGVILFYSHHSYFVSRAFIL